MKAFSVSIFVAIAVCAVCSMTVHDISIEWKLFKSKFNKEYKNSEEEISRKNLYLNNMRKIEEHNKLYKNGQVSYKLGMNRFGDMSIDEITSTMKGFKQSLKIENDDNSVTYMVPENGVIPNSVDWRDKGYVTPVKDQGRCGSCWAFSSTGSLEGQYFRKTGKLVSLSEQNLVDCTGLYGNFGCHGGLMSRAFRYIKYNRGIDTEDSYPYNAKKDKCMYSSKNKGATDNGFISIPKGDEKLLKNAVGTVGPVSVAIDASSIDFHFYSEGVFYDPLCSSTYLDHAVLVVGYNTTESGDDYWIVKNSWGKTWGKNGYILMSRNNRNNCGIASMAIFPLV